ncbi:uncharacterized protein LACBIDRAFT_304417 [Laccaria bicolor S238N-H82]|uniref:Predicted protein n=1 Tax=Laccaria bicolor (strain S238N-H82 / ATCC MYA-4686) TaxID=486041 RepID=B0DLK8_LACBS|nr:uncharacterized protein LACBIDRAFT_304417 [Laccaria bicolor S238N-H82]EDR04664.1 predicted protein [Laccaria bicolor S238N-H82]|eukprot:XP_001884836.1 predicted protein [Laccaria bicolor S238N-H82]
MRNDNDAPCSSQPPQSTWNSITPWSPQLNLSVREITSVSATFILSSDLNGEFDISLASIGFTAAADDDDDDEDQASSSSKPDFTRKGPSIITEALAKGLSVTVNATPWQRVFIRIDDKVDEAVIIIYGLMPGRQYDIDLAVVQAGKQSTLRQQVITEDDSDHDTADVHTDPDSMDHSTSSSDPPQSTPSTSPSRTIPSTPPPLTAAAPQITLEDRLSQLRHALSLAEAERESLASSLKTARRDAQKADAALRSEMDILKRASEKNAAGEHRAKQKILALQEAVKRAQAATRETEEMVRELEEQLPELLKQKSAKEEEYAKVKAEADLVRRERDCASEKEKKRLEAMRVELAGLNNKLERLSGKREKLEVGTIPDLEEQLKEVEREIEVERLSDQVDYSAYVLPRPRQQSLGASCGPGPISRPSPAHIHRPDGSHSPSSTTGLGGHWNISPRHHNPRSSSLQQHTPTILANPMQRRSSLKSTTTPTTPTSPSPTATSTAITSTLSSRAASFEPGRPLKGTTTATTSGFSVSPIPIQRSTGAAQNNSIGSKTQRTGIH